MADGVEIEKPVHESGEKDTSPIQDLPVNKEEENPNSSTETGDMTNDKRKSVGNTIKKLSAKRQKILMKKLLNSEQIVKLIPLPHARQPVMLPVYERYLYFVVWTAAALYSIYCVVDFSINMKITKSLSGFFVHGWSILGRSKDISNFEWTFWTRWSLRVWPWFIGYFVVKQAVKKWSQKVENYKQYIILTYQMIALCWILGIGTLLFTLLNCIMAYGAAMYGSTVLVWISSAVLINLLNCESFNSNFVRFVTNYEDNTFYLFLFSIAMCNLRYTSFAFDWINAKKAESSNRNNTAGNKNAKDEEKFAEIAKTIFAYTPDEKNTPANETKKKKVPTATLR